MLSAPTGRRLDRPENAGLKPYFAKLAAAKAAIDEKSATIGACPWIFSKTYSASSIKNTLSRNEAVSVTLSAIGASLGLERDSLRSHQRF